MANGKSMADVSAGFQKTYGKEIGGTNVTLTDRTRIPTDIFELDRALGGGVPRGCVIEIFGPESSCKTNIVLKLIAAHQRLYPEEVCVFFDLERTYDPEWAAILGVDTKKLHVYQPLYAEQATDMVQEVLGAEDCGFLAIDSIAAMATAGEIDNSAEKAAVGGNSYVVGRLVKKIVVALGAAHMAKRTPTIAFINQTRFKIGVMFQDPETTPGGNAPKFAATMRIRTYAKNIKDAKVSDTMPVRKEISVVIKKWKVPIVSTHAKFEMAMLPHKDLKPGQCDDWKTIEENLKAYGLLMKDKGGWIMCGDPYPTLIACKDKVMTDLPFGALVRKALIERALEDVIAKKATSPDIPTEEDQHADA